MTAYEISSRQKQLWMDGSRSVHSLFILSLKSSLKAVSCQMCLLCGRSEWPCHYKSYIFVLLRRWQFSISPIQLGVPQKNLRHLDTGRAAFQYWKYQTACATWTNWRTSPEAQMNWQNNTQETRPKNVLLTGQRQEQDDGEERNFWNRLLGFSSIREIAHFPPCWLHRTGFGALAVL